MTQNDHTHKMNEPWTTLGHLRADLRQARALLRRKPKRSTTNDDVLAIVCVDRALARIGDDNRSEL